MRLIYFILRASAKIVVWFFILAIAAEAGTKTGSNGTFLVTLIVLGLIYFNWLRPKFLAVKGKHVPFNSFEYSTQKGKLFARFERTEAIVRLSGDINRMLADGANWNILFEDKSVTLLRYGEEVKSINLTQKEFLCGDMSGATSEMYGKALQEFIYSRIPQNIRARYVMHSFRSTYTLNLGPERATNIRIEDDGYVNYDIAGGESGPLYAWSFCILTAWEKQEIDKLLAQQEAEKHF